MLDSKYYTEVYLDRDCESETYTFVPNAAQTSSL